ncbi:MAG: helix-turn-helix domain-containing protein, partial [Pseudonocardia sediminis]
MPLGSDYASQACSLARALEVVGERWTLLILRDCFYGVRRFTDLHRHLGVPRAVLAERLESLTEAGVLRREEAGPGRVEYLLTERGQELWPVLHALYGWGERHAAAVPRRRIFRHVACDTGSGDVGPGDVGSGDAELDDAGRCPSCGVTPEAGEIRVHPGPGLA